MISERLLRKWRKEALEFKRDIEDMAEAQPTVRICMAVLRLTQELLDQHLISKNKEKS